MNERRSVCAGPAVCAVDGLGQHGPCHAVWMMALAAVGWALHCSVHNSCRGGCVALPRGGVCRPMHTRGMTRDSSIALIVSGGHAERPLSHVIIRCQGRPVTVDVLGSSYFANALFKWRGSCY